MDRISELIAQLRGNLTAKADERKAHADKLDEIRGACLEAKRDPSDEEAAQVTTARAAKLKVDGEIAEIERAIAELEEEKRSDDAAAKIARATGAPESTRQATRVVSEPRTYARETDPKGVQFLQDVAMRFISQDFGANERLSRHMSEERVERGADVFDRAVGTSAFSGLVVPQYLTDQFAPFARAGRPFADACRHHDLPETGMVVNIGALTTGTTADDQVNEGDAVNETNADDTLLSAPIRTNAGQQTISRQGVERGVGIDDTTIEDLFSAYGTSLDAKLLNRAVSGLSAVATSIAYTDATPTAVELYPKLLQGPAQVEAALVNQAAGDAIAVMHSRRWYWLQSQLTSTFPLFGQPGTAPQNAGVNYGEKYGSGFRGMLPSGTPVIVDNNIATNLGAGTNEDEIYFAAQSECHLWEDPNAPMLIKADQAKAANLQILLVVYGYYASLFNRRAHAQKVAGTGLVTPAFV